MSCCPPPPLPPTPSPLWVCLQVVADYFGAGIDDTHIKMRGAPVLEEPSLSSHQKMIADKLTVSELMTMAVVALPPVVKVCCPHVLHFCICLHSQIPLCNTFFFSKVWQYVRETALSFVVSSEWVHFCTAAAVGDQADWALVRCAMLCHVVPCCAVLYSVVVVVVVVVVFFVVVSSLSNNLA